MIDLKELADEYCDLLARYESDDEEDHLDDEELERFNDLKKINDEFGDALYFPGHIGGITLVKDDHSSLEAWGIQYVEDHVEGGVPDVVSNYIDYKKLAEDVLSSEYETIEIEGEDYYYYL